MTDMQIFCFMLGVVLTTLFKEPIQRFVFFLVKAIFLFVVVVFALAGYVIVLIFCGPSAAKELGKWK